MIKKLLWVLIGIAAIAAILLMGIGWWIGNDNLLIAGIIATCVVAMLIRTID